jgi:hypothetical protein
VIVTRRMVDCRTMPSEINCTLTIAGEEEKSSTPP